MEETKIMEKTKTMKKKLTFGKDYLKKVKKKILFLNKFSSLSFLAINIRCSKNYE
jgi:hypothetical protein